MADSTGEDFLTKKHNRLLNIASVASVFAWIALGSQVLYMGGRFVHLQNLYMLQNMNAGFGQPNFMKMLSQNLAYTFDLIVDLANILIRGCVYWLVLNVINLSSCLVAIIEALSISI